MRVIVVGGGIGGLAVAQGLALRGVDVLVLERDTDLSLTGGYKLHLGPAACESVRDLVPNQLWEVLRASAVKTPGFELAVRDHKGRLLALASDKQTGESLDIDRVTLRLALATGLGERLRTGITCTEFHEIPYGVVVTLSTGERLDGDVLVLADGARSALVAHVKGARPASDTGLVGIAGRTPVAALPRSSRDLLQGQPMLSVGPGGVGLFASWHSPDTRKPSIAVTKEPTVIWGLISTAAQLPVRPHELAGEELALLATELLIRRRWSPTLTSLPSTSTISSIAAFSFLAADPDHLAEWAPGRVTAIGDAAHAMPPTGGQGAATAILDAAHLAARLADAAHGRTSIAEALQSSLDATQEHAPQAVRDSLEPVRWIKASAHPAGWVVGSVGLPLLAGLAAVTRRLRPRS